jgi:hypothetical protein
MSFKTVSMAIEAAIALAHLLTDPLSEELPGLLLEPLYHSGLEVFI